MKTKDFKLLKWLCSMVMVAMGFTACSKDEPEEVYYMYGTPTCDYKISGIVKDAKYKAIPGINVVLQKSNNGIKEDVMTIKTDKDGKFSTEYFNSEDVDIAYVKFTDVDGPENGGEFEDKTISAWGMFRTKVGEGNGWYSGKYDLYDEIKLKLKPEDSAENDDSPKTEE